MLIRYEPPSKDITDDEFMEDFSSFMIAIIDAETSVKSSPCSDKTLNTLSEQAERKQLKINKLEEIIKKQETLNGLHKNTLASLEQLHSEIKKRLVNTNSASE